MGLSAYAPYQWVTLTWNPSSDDCSGILGYEIVSVPAAVCRHGEGTVGVSLRETGQYLFEHTVRRVETAKSIDRVVLATDADEIVAAASEVRVDRTAVGTPDAVLARGRVRVIDAREGGEPARLAARDSEVRVVGNDAEAYLLAEKIGPYAMFCEWDAPLAVAQQRGPVAATKVDVLATVQIPRPATFGSVK